MRLTRTISPRTSPVRRDPALRATRTRADIADAALVCARLQSERSFAAAIVAHDLHSGVVDAVQPSSSSSEGAAASPHLYPLLSAQPNPHHARQMRVLNARLHQAYHHSPDQQSALIEPSLAAASAADASADTSSAPSTAHTSAAQPLSPFSAEAMFGMGGGAVSARKTHSRPHTADRQPYNHPRPASTAADEGHGGEHGIAATPQRGPGLPLLQLELPEADVGDVRVVPPPPADGSWAAPWPPSSAAPSPLVIDEAADGDSQRPRDALAFRVDWERELRLVTDPRAELDRSTAAGESEEDAADQLSPQQADNCASLEPPVPLFILQRRERERQKQLQALHAQAPATEASAAASAGVDASTAAVQAASAGATPSHTPRPPQRQRQRQRPAAHGLFDQKEAAPSSQPVSARRAAAISGRPARPVRPLSATAPLAAEPPPRPSLASGKRAPRYTSRAFYGAPSPFSSSAAAREPDPQQSYFIAVPPERPWTAEGRSVAASQPPYFNPRTRKQQRHAPILR